MSSLEVTTKDHRIGSLDDVKVTFDVGTLLKDKNDPETMAIVEGVYSLYERHKLKIEEINANNLAYLDQQHEAAVVAAREAKEALESTTLYGARFDQETRDLTQRLSRAHMNMRLLKSRPPNPSYALKSDYAEHERKVQEAQAEIDAALTAQNRHEAAFSEWQRSAETRRAALTEAVRIEEDLRFRLNKAKGVKQEQRPDRETGFMMS